MTKTMAQLRAAMTSTSRAHYRCCLCNETFDNVEDHARDCEQAREDLGPGSALVEMVTLRGRDLDRSEWKAVRAKHYPRRYLANFFFPGIIDWLGDPFNAADFHIAGSLHENDTRAWFEFTVALPDIDTAMLCKLRWSLPKTA